MSRAIFFAHGAPHCLYPKCGDAQCACQGLGSRTLSGGEPPSHALGEPPSQAGGKSPPGGTATGRYGDTNRTDAWLRGVELGQAILGNANLNGAGLDGADLTGTGLAEEEKVLDTAGATGGGQPN